MFIGIDFGGTSCRVVGYGSLEEGDEVAREKFDLAGSYDEDMPRLKKVIGRIANGADIQGIGYGTPGAVTEDRRKVIWNPNQRSWTDKPIADEFEQAFGCRAVLGNDAEAFAVGEAFYGYGKEEKDFWFVTWGTGLGAALVRMESDAPTFFASEFGHSIMDISPDALVCKGCGNRGCAESFCAGKMLAERYGKPAAELSEDQWLEVEERMATYLHNLFLAQPTKLIVLGGGVAFKQAHRASAIEKKIGKILVMYDVPPRVLPSANGEDGGLLGAVGFLRQY